MCIVLAESKHPFDAAPLHQTPADERGTDRLPVVLGHSLIQTMLIYLELVPNPTGNLAMVP